MKTHDLSMPQLIQISAAWNSREGAPLERNQYVELEIKKPKPNGTSTKLPANQKPCEKMAETIVVDGGKRGQVVKVCADPACRTHHPNTPSPQQVERERIEERKRIEKEKLVITTRHRVLATILQRVSAPLKKADLLAVAHYLIGHLSYSQVPALAKRHKVEAKKDSASAEELLAKQVGTYDEACSLATSGALSNSELTDAGRLFVEEARSALSHTERAVHLARAAHEGSDSILTIGHSPYADHDWISALFAIRLPLYPRLGIRLKTRFAMESVHSVLVGELDLALVTAPPPDPQITAVPYAPAPLYAAVPETHTAAHKEQLVLQDLAKDEWVLFAKRVHPLLYEAVMEAARRESIIPKHAHDVMAPQQAVDLVSDHVGIAILTQPTAAGFHADGVVVKPLSDASLCFETCVIMRTDNGSRLVNEYVRMFLRKYALFERQDSRAPDDLVLANDRMISLLDSRISIANLMAFLASKASGAA